MAETEIAGIWQSRTRARPKKKANCRVVVTKSSDKSVEKTVVATVATAEDKNNEPTLQVEPSAVPVEVATEVAMEPSEMRTETASPSFLSLEHTRSVRSEDVAQQKISEELAKELTLSVAILEQVIA